MKRILLLLVLLFVCTTVYAEPIPEMRPSAPDVRSEVEGEPMEYQQPKDNSVTEEEEEYEEEEEEVEETDEPEEPQKVEEPQKTSPKAQEDITVDEETANDIKELNNSVNNPDAKAQKVKKVKKEKVKKEKKEKPKYGKYKDADSDPYIQKWEEELKQLNNAENSTELTDEEKSKQQEEAQKFYSQADYEQAYRDMPVPDFSFVHGVDPDQYYDMKDTMWSPYPLMRLNSPLYFKTITIEPGYYLLTPRKYKDNWYILFKEAGAIKYTIPVFDKSFTPEFYYRDNLREADMSRSARWQVKFLDAWGKYVRKSKRKPPTKCNVELTDLDNNFLLLELYYGPHKYSTIFRVEKY